ncbi:hypothetical protein F4818DRAFT_437718 [Hypoxylon cercidicola]|nr:hypothetical protein F4818DRAFT_437718 [Hypoxylon cercidicola]
MPTGRARTGRHRVRSPTGSRQPRRSHAKIPACYDVPLSFAFANGYQFGKYVANLGPQTASPVPEGVLDQNGTNTVTLNAVGAGFAWRQARGTGSRGFLRGRRGESKEGAC